MYIYKTFDTTTTNNKNSHAGKIGCTVLDYVFAILLQLMCNQTHTCTSHDLETVISKAFRNYT